MRSALNLDLLDLLTGYALQLGCQDLLGIGAEVMGASVSLGQAVGGTVSGAAAASKICEGELLCAGGAAIGGGGLLGGCGCGGEIRRGDVFGCGQSAHERRAGGRS